MNLSRGWLTTGKPRRLAAACRACSLVVLGSLAPLAGHHSLARLEDATDRAGQSAQADVLPGVDEPAAPDLQIQGDSASKADALADFSEALIAEDGADSDAALDDFKKALALDPGYTELAVKVAFELTRRGDPSGAIQVLKDSIKASPKAPLAYLYLSQIYLKNLEKPDIGLKYAQQALDLDPGNFASYLAVTQFYQTLQEPDKAVAALDRAAAEPSTDPQFWLQLGDLYLKTLPDPISADQLVKVSAVYHKALALAADDPVTLDRVGDFYLRTHREKEAIPLFLKALKLSPANPPDGDQTLASIRDSLAQCFSAVGRTSEAIAMLQQIIKDNPLRYDSYGLLCDEYEKANNIDAALGVCQQMILLDQTDFRNYIRIAALLMKQKKIDAAIQTLTDARVKFPTEAQVTYSLGLALSEAKRYKEALGIFDQAADEASQGQTEMLPAAFYFAWGAAAEESGDVDKAAMLLKKSADLDPESAAEAYNYIGYMWVDRGMKLEEGADYIRKALKMEPDNPAYIDSLGWYFFKKGDLKQAVSTLKRAATLIQPEDATVDEHLGDAYAAANETARALDYWQRSAALDKENKEIAVKIAGARQKLARQGGGSAPATP